MPAIFKRCGRRIRPAGWTRNKVMHTVTKDRHSVLKTSRSSQCVFLTTLSLSSRALIWLFSMVVTWCVVCRVRACESTNSSASCTITAHAATALKHTGMPCTTTGSVLDRDAVDLYPPCVRVLTQQQMCVHLQRHTDEKGGCSLANPTQEHGTMLPSRLRKTAGVFQTSLS